MDHCDLSVACNLMLSGSDLEKRMCGKRGLTRELRGHQLTLCTAIKHEIKIRRLVSLSETWSLRYIPYTWTGDKGFFFFFLFLVLRKGNVQPEILQLVPLELSIAYGGNFLLTSSPRWQQHSLAPNRSSLLLGKPVLKGAAASPVSLASALKCIWYL